MKVILKSDNKTLEFVGGSQTINVNDDLVQVFTVRPEIPLADEETLSVVFKYTEDEEIKTNTLPLFGETEYTTYIPEGVIDVIGEWGFTVLRRRYKTAEHTGTYTQIATHAYTFTVGEGVKISGGEPATVAALQTLYDMSAENATAAAASATAAETAKEAASKSATAAETARNEASEAAAEAIAAKETAAEAATAAETAKEAAQIAASEAAAEAVAAAETAQAQAEVAAAAAIAAKTAAETAQADATAAATEAAAEAVREAVERIDATEKKTAELEKDIAVVNNILTQGGITYKADTETAYNERITAEGLNVLDGSKAVLKKVVGSTVACRNLVDIPFIGSTTASKEITVNFDKGIFVSVAGSVDVRHDDIWRFKFVFKDGKVSYIKDPAFRGGGMKISATADNPIVQVSYRGEGITAGQYSKIMIEYGDTATEYQPYFTGLKNASFAGIESTNADGTETSTLAFPKTETGLGTTIDFETKKITDYGVAYEFTGNEKISYSSYWGRNGVLVETQTYTIPQPESIYVCTDTNATKASEYGYMILNYGGAFCLWSGILDKLGITTQGATLTAEEQSTAVATFKAWLAQRYADKNPVVVRYLAKDVQSETPITDNNKYTAWSNGTEKVLGNDNAEYGAKNMLTQNYIVVKE